MVSTSVKFVEVAADGAAPLIEVTDTEIVWSPVAAVLPSPVSTIEPLVCPAGISNSIGAPTALTTELAPLEIE